MCLISWERTPKRDPHQLFWEDFWGQKGGPKRGIFGHKKFSLLFFVLPLVAVVSLTRSQSVFCGGASRWFSESLAFRSSDSQSLNQRYTMWFRQSTVSLLNKTKPLADTSNKSTTPYPPRQYVIYYCHRNYYQINSLGIFSGNVPVKNYRINCWGISIRNSLQDFVHGISVRVSWDRWTARCFW